MLGVSRDSANLATHRFSYSDLEEEYTFKDLLEEENSIILDFSTEGKPYFLRANFSVIQKETG